MGFRSPVIIALGSNLPSRVGSPRLTLERAIGCLRRAGLDVYRVSPWFASAPVPMSPQAMFLNGALCVRTALAPERLLAVLHTVERSFGRTRRARNAARTLDLDIVAYGNMVRADPGARHLILPHPRAHLRAFVLQPLRAIVPAWRHPVLGVTAIEFLGELGGRSPGGRIVPVSRPLHRSARPLKKVVRPKNAQGAATWPV